MASIDIRSSTDGVVVVVVAVDGGGCFNSASRIPSTMSSHIQINALKAVQTLGARGNAITDRKKKGGVK